MKGAILAGYTVGVMGSGSENHEQLANKLGRLLARMGVNLLTGAGGGVMSSVSFAYTDEPRTSGICIGIVPCRSESDRNLPKKGYPNEFVELEIRTHLPFSGELGKHDLSRNHINVLSSNVIVALPGGAGTATEVSLALDYGKPIIAYAQKISDMDSLPSQVTRTVELDEVEEFIRHHLKSDLH